MRSVAVLLVVASHYFFYSGHSTFFGLKIWALGILGVAIFFVHTTLVLMWSLERDSSTLRFYLRRIFRLWPLWLVVLGLYVTLYIPGSPAFAPAFGYQAPDLRHLLANIFLVFNLIPGYPIVGASWSLPVEMQMYLVLPLLYVSIRKNKSLLPLFLIQFLILAFCLMALPPINSSVVFCSGFFLPGVMAYVGFTRFRTRFPSWIFPLWLAALVLCANAILSHSANSFRGGWPFCLILGLTLPLFRQIQSPALRKASHLIARYSYGIYLLHVPALVVSLHLLAGHGRIIQLAAFFITLAGSSVVLYHLVEEPAIRFGSRLAKRLTGLRPTPVTDLAISLDPAP